MLGIFKSRLLSTLGTSSTFYQNNIRIAVHNIMKDRFVSSGSTDVTECVNNFVNHISVLFVRFGVTAKTVS